MSAHTSKTRAFVLTDGGEIASTTVEVPTPSDSEVLVRITAAGVCGTDLAEFRRRRAAPGVHPALAFGHEIAAVVAGDNQPELPVGAAVVVDPALYCSNCTACRRGATNYCAALKVVGHNAGFGGFADHLVVPAMSLIRVPDYFDPAVSALIEPLSCAYHAVRRASDADPAMPTVVIGAGTIGIGIGLVLRANGFANVVLVDPAQRRRADAESLGFSAFPRVPSEPADLVFEASGTTAGFQSGTSAVARGGHIVVVAYHDGHLSLDAELAFGKEIRLSWSLGALRADFSRIISMLDKGTIATDGVTTLIAPSELDTSLLDAMAAGECPKIVMRMA